MTEQSTTAMQSSSGASVALVFQAGAMRVPVDVDIRDLCPILTFPVRPWGEPVRCEVCGKPVSVEAPGCGGALGRYRCQEHRNRTSGMVGEPDGLRIQKIPSNVVTLPATGRKNIPLSEAIPVLAEPPVRPSGTPTMSLRERLAARRAAEGTQG